MDVGTAMVFVAVGAACLYLLTHPEQVRYPLALKIACISLGSSLIFSALLGLPRDPGASLDAISRGAFLRHLFIGISVIALLFVTYPFQIGVASRPSGERGE
jgi:hypothetical protein